MSSTRYMIKAPLWASPELSKLRERCMWSPACDAARERVVRLVVSEMQYLKELDTQGKLEHVERMGGWSAIVQRAISIETAGLEEDLGAYGRRNLVADVLLEKVPELRVEVLKRLNGGIV